MNLFYNIKGQGSNLLLKIGVALIFIGLLILLLKEIISFELINEDIFLIFMKSSIENEIERYKNKIKHLYFSKNLN